MIARAETGPDAAVRPWWRTTAGRLALLVTVVVIVGLGVVLGNAPRQQTPAAVPPPIAASPQVADADQPDGEASPATSVDRGWASRVSSAAGIPERALVAYASATLTIDAEQPDCGLGWNTLAAIGSIESGHGSHGGSVLGDDGWTTPRILGPPLDGNGNAAISDTDGGAWDGDTVWDRAVGPMQFIPDTWHRWGADGNADGIADPSQLDDAAVAAARYLCASGSMTTAEGWRAAIFSYNHLDSYVDEVAVIANKYASRAQGAA